MRTPQWLFDWLSDRYGPFQLDAAATAKNALCDEYYDEATDALTHPWYDKTFCNPPFAKFGDWIAKAAHEAVERNVRSVLIAPVGCSQKWYHQVAARWTVLVPDRRISFCMPDGTPTSSADRDSIFILIGPGWDNTHQYQFRCLPVTLPAP